MKFFLLVSTLFLSVTGFAQLNFPEIPQSKPYAIDYTCTNHGGGYAFKMTKPYRAWQIDPSIPDAGIELSALNVLPARCRDCYRISAVLLGQINIQAVMTGVSQDKITLDVVLTSQNQKPVEIQYTCQAHYKSSH